MASPEALAKLRAVLDYIPEEAGRRLDGDPQEYYDALTRRMHRTVAVKSMVRRKVIVQQPDVQEDVEPSAPWYEPPVEPEPAPPPTPYLNQAGAEASSVVEARPSSEPEEEAAPAEDFFDVTGKGRKMEPVEPEVSLNDKEWQRLQSSPQTEPQEEVAEAPAVAGQEEQEEAFEEIIVPSEVVPRLPEEPRVGSHLGTELGPGAEPETAVQERALEPGRAEFEVQEAGEVSQPEEFEVLAEDEAEVVEGDEPPYQINEYTLFARSARTRGGKARPTYFFSAEPEVDGASPASLPEGYEVLVNETSGVPVIRKSLFRILPAVEIEGLGPVMAERLERAGVRTTRDLLRIDLRTVSSETGISERLLANFRAMADLLQMPGIYPDQAAALVYAGTRSLTELRDANPVELAKQVNQAAKDHQLKLRGKMTPSRIKAWQQKFAKLKPE